MMAFEFLISQIIYAAISYLWYLKCVNQKTPYWRDLKEIFLYCSVYLFVIWTIENLQLQASYYLLAAIVSSVVTAIILRTNRIQMVSLLALGHGITILIVTISSFVFYLILWFIPGKQSLASAYYLPYIISLIVSVILIHKIHFPKKFHLMLDHYGKLIALINSMLVLLICGLLAFSYDRHQSKDWYLLGAMFLIATTLFLYLKDKRKEKLKEDQWIQLSQKMIRDTHSQKEIQKVLIQEYQDLLYCAENVTRGNEICWNLEEMHQRLAEFQQLSATNLHSLEDAAYFVQDTGSVVLNDMLRQFAGEFAEKKIQFESHTVSSIGELITEQQIPLAKLLELFGDLLRNAMQAVERKRNVNRETALTQDHDVVHIWMGKQYQGKYHIDFYDSGQPFFLEILENMGSYGNTTGGTGYGMANLLKMLSQYRASLIIAEYSVDPAPFTKCITIAFDGKNQLVIESYRYEELLKKEDQLPFEIRPLNF